jgi:hypothetical protein
MATDAMLSHPSRDSCTPTFLFCLISQLVESHLLGTKDNVLGDMTQPRRLDPNSLAGYHPRSKCTFGIDR